MIPKEAPVKNAIYSAVIMFGKLKNSPRKNTNFMSPPPMLSFPSNTENTTEMITKNKKAEIPQTRLIIDDEGLINNR